MLRATIWRDLRWRLLAATLLVVPPAMLIAWSFATQARESSVAPSALAFFDAAWFWLPGPSAVFLLAAVVIGASGSVLRPRHDVAYLLTLPVSRRRWLLTHVAMASAALAALVLAAHLILAAAAWSVGAPLAIGPFLGRSLAVLVAATAWVGVTAGAVLLTRHPAIAGLLVLGIVAVTPPNRFRLELPLRPLATVLPSWDPWALADPRFWSGGVPLASGLAALALGGAGLLLASHLVERYEP